MTQGDFRTNRGGEEGVYFRLNSARIESMKIKAKIVSSGNKVVLLEWQDEKGAYFRGFVQMSDVVLFEQDPTTCTIAQEVLEGSVPYGDDLASVVSSLPVTDEMANEFSEELKRRGVWTYTDLLEKPMVLRAVVNVVNPFNVAFILNEVRTKLEK